MVLGGAGGGLRGMLRAEIMDTARDQFLVDVWINFMQRIPHMESTPKYVNEILPAGYQ